MMNPFRAWCQIYFKKLRSSCAANINLPVTNLAPVPAVYSYWWR